MSPTNNSRLADTTEIDAGIDALVRLEPSDAPFLSCYLDGRAGAEDCTAFVRAKAAAMRNALDPAQRFDFDDALNRVLQQIDRECHRDTRGMALFARGPGGGRHLSVLHIASSVENSLVLYRAPEIVPLLSLRDRDARFTLMLVRGGRVQVLDVEMGGTTPVVWAAMPATPVPRKLINSQTVQRLSPRTRAIRRALAVRGNVPLVVAGDAAEFDELMGWLPARVRSRCVEQLSVPGTLSDDVAIGRARDTMIALRKCESAQFATRLMRELRPQGRAVAGPVATEQALREGNADTLLVAEMPTVAAGTGWDARIELARLARRQGISIVASAADELHNLGGVACLLRQRSDRTAMPLPTRGQVLTAS